MRQRLLALSLVLTFCASTSSAQDSFIVYRYFFSDDLSGWNEKILDVAQVGADVRVRMVQLSFANPVCGDLLVQAVEKTLSRTTVRQVAEMNVCANTPRGVRMAVSEAEAHGVHMETSSQAITAWCGGKPRELELPWDADVDFEKLKQFDPRVVELYRLIYGISSRVFGKSFWFEPGEQQPAREALGLALAPELTSGRYAYVLGERINQLKTYKSPAPMGERGPKPQLVDAETLHLTSFVAPVYPSIAQSARVQGDVQLRVTADARTGAVATVEVVSGSPLLTIAAVEAAKAWRFDPAFLDGQPRIVTVRFSLNC